MIRRPTSGGAAVALAGFALVAVTSAGCGPPGHAAERFTDVREQTKQFMHYNKTIALDAEEEWIFRQALSAIPAPCCSNNPALTCCCPCNMAQSWWGLAKHLIANEGLGVDDVKATVEAWIEFINPDGFSGDVCYTGGCNRPFAENGCGGMDDKHVIFD